VAVGAVVDGRVVAGAGTVPTVVVADEPHAAVTIATMSAMVLFT